MNKKKTITLLLAIMLAITSMLIPLTASAEEASDYRVNHTKPTASRVGYFNKYSYFPFDVDFEFKADFKVLYKINNINAFGTEFSDLDHNMTGKEIYKDRFWLVANGATQILDNLTCNIDEITSSIMGPTPIYTPRVYFNVKFSYKSTLLSKDNLSLLFHNTLSKFYILFDTPFQKNMTLKDTVTNKIYDISFLSIFSSDAPEISYKFTYPNNNYLVNSLDIYLGNLWMSVGSYDYVYPTVSVGLNEFSNITTFQSSFDAYVQVYYKELAESQFKVNNFSVSAKYNFPNTIALTDKTVSFEFMFLNLNFYSKENNLVNTGGLGTNAEYKTCEWYDIPCHLGNAVVYMIYDFPLTKNITTFVTSAMNFFSETFGIINKFNGFGVMFIFAGGVLMLFIIKKVAGG